MTESHVEQAVTARIAAAKRRTEDMRRQRAELAAARQAGLAKRHAAKLAHQASRQREASDPCSDSVDASDATATETDQ